MGGGSLGSIPGNLPGRQIERKFQDVRDLQISLEKTDPEYTDLRYWKSNRWTEGEKHDCIECNIQM
jgi:hypothetical protein